jgi:hypothetical protein
MRFTSVGLGLAFKYYDFEPVCDRRSWLSAGASAAYLSLVELENDPRAWIFSTAAKAPMSA